MTRRNLLIAAMLIGSLAGPPLWAQEEAPKGPPADAAVKLEEARHLLTEANAHRDAGRFDEAATAYEKAIALLDENGAGKEEVASVLNELGVSDLNGGRPAAALVAFERSLALFREVYVGNHPNLAVSLNNVATTLVAVGRPADALPFNEEALAMRRSIYKGDHPEVAQGIKNLASTLRALGRPADALPLNEEALAMYRRLFQGDHPDVAQSLNNLASALAAVGRYIDAVPLLEEALAMRRNLFKGDHPEVATSLNNLAAALAALGRPSDALPREEEALAMSRRMFRNDHPDIAWELNGLAITLDALGRPADALPLFEESLAIYRRLFRGDHPEVAKGLNNLAMTLGARGRHTDALQVHEESLAMSRRLFHGDHPDVAINLNNLAFTLGALGRPAEALPFIEESLAMKRRLFIGDHPSVVMSLNNLASTLEALGRPADALPLLEVSAAMGRRLFGGDHPDIALSLSNLAQTLDALGRFADALPARCEAAEMGRRMGWPARHIPLVALGIRALATGDSGSALAPLAEAIDHVESLREQARALGTEEGARYSTWTRRVDPFPPMIEALVALKRMPEALEYLERGRARAMLALLEEGRGDPLAEAAARARAAGDTAAVARLDAAAKAVADADSEIVVRARACERARAGGVREEIRAAIDAESEARRALEKAMRDRLQLLRDVLPETRPLGASEIQALLRPGERMLVYSLGERKSFVFVVRPQGEEIEAVPLPATLKEIEAAVAEHAAAVSGGGGDPGRRLFDLVVPAKVWTEVKAAKRVYVLAHGALHRVPFETLVVGEGPRYWIDEAPAVAYAASASVLAQLARRSSARAPGPLDLVALGDPRFEVTAAPWPEKGVLLREVAPDGQAAGLGLRAGDVLVK